MAAIRTRIYSPAQITLGALWGGPVAAVYFIHCNFAALGRAREARHALALGCGACLAFLLALPFLPEQFPSLLLPLGYSLAALLVVMRWLPSADTIRMDSKLDFQSGWRVFFTGLLCLVLTCLLAAAIMLALSGLGLLDLR